MSRSTVVVPVGFGIEQYLFDWVVTDHLTSASCCGVRLGAGFFSECILWVHDSWQHHRSGARDRRWDKAKQAFFFSVASDTLNASATIYYAGGDSMLPSMPAKLLAARAFVPNCTTLLTSAEVLFSNVSVNESRVRAAVCSVQMHQSLTVGRMSVGRELAVQHRSRGRFLSLEDIAPILLAYN
jgi:hypothetical protein